ncbi:class I SAM-dependent methyltransferase [Citreimonas salinaria]|uniref:16S rRNA (Guanine1207-N2)-methyltransferase n=1 Tax=Citreimonas salinaria TaxID=321339 RepID=A0A1H3I1K2_9RHOB|nr:methyltransferase [Citreimonas salinaria]SDY21502.1 16S rRNA (guanine1207-N2)-methyltransferase [Citreimonas salinaria]
MSSHNPDRLSHAIQAGLALPPGGRVALVAPLLDAPLPPVDPARLAIVQPLKPDHDIWRDRGMNVATALDGSYAATIVTLPRARDLAQDRIARAEAATPGGLVVVDGAKTDGIEAMVKALRARLADALHGPVSKAHGKVVWFEAAGALADWILPEMSPNAEGDMTAPGIFSADGADPGSRALAEALPARLPDRVADLGAGWGWLSREILSRGVTELHLVEADLRALDCARANVDDPRARFHWADATAWQPDAPLEAVVMNPPFHAGRKGDPDIGKAFIAAAARMLGPRGQLWLVANQHLPYEPALTAAFRDVSETGGDTKFKILHAARPHSDRRGRSTPGTG